MRRDFYRRGRYVTASLLTIYKGYLMNNTYDKLRKCYCNIRRITDFVPETALVLGSGLGGLADEIETVCTISYSQIEGIPVSTVEGHKGFFVFGYIDTVPVVIMQGRVHYYEGYPMSDVVLPERIMGMLGAKSLFLTNAAGGIRADMKAGDLMLITGQISSFVPSPLIGPNIDEMGVRFPDMSEIYDKQLQGVIKQAAAETGIPLKEGTYIQFTGPNYESPEEIRMAAALGADAVGMSTACEAIAARHMGMRVCGISCISNMAAGISDHPLSHEEVKAAADKAGPAFKKLVKESLVRIGKII